MLYPVLHRLERLGHVEARWETAEGGRRRKYYGITAQGRTQLDEERRQCQGGRDAPRHLALDRAGHPGRLPRIDRTLA